MKRIASGIGIALLGTVGALAILTPSGALQGRTASLRTDEPIIITTTTIDTAATLERPEPVAVAIPEPIATTSTTVPTPITGKPPMAPGHYDCTDDNACTLTTTGDPGPNDDESDSPDKTVAANDAGYRAHLATGRCADGISWCDVDSSGHYIDKDASR